jgi:hypothetical protein
MLSEIEDGGPAYPSTDANGFTGVGISVRDYFAAQCLSGLCSLGKNLEDDSAPDDWTQADVVASQAYAIADAMLKHREIKV